MAMIERRGEILAENLYWHPAVVAWRKLQQIPKIPTNVIVLRPPTAKGSVYILNGVGRKGSDVVAKQSGAIERVIYEQILPGLSVQIPIYYGSVRDAEHDQMWIFQEYVSGMRPFVVGMGWKETLTSQQTFDFHGHLAARWLGRLHTAASGGVNGVKLPDRNARYYLRLLQETRNQALACLSYPYLTPPDFSTLFQVAYQCDVIETFWDEIERFCDRIPQTVVHGDFVSKNLRVRQSGGRYDIVAFDWEMAGWGLPACDLHWLCRSTGLLSHVDTYLAAVREKWPSLDGKQVGTLCYIGRLFRLLDSINWAAFPYADKFGEGRVFIEQIQWYKTAATQCIRDLQERLRC